MASQPDKPPVDPLSTSPEALLASARRTLEIERDTLNRLVSAVGEDFARACQWMLACSGRVVVMGVGKSGHVASKLAATLASTGTPAFFIHPAEAAHGDLGMVTADDLVLALSNSGSSNEVIDLLPALKRLGAGLIAMTGHPDSPLALAADVHIEIPVTREACPLELAPTASTTGAMAMGDALAIALLEARGFTSREFAAVHPGGRLGKRLLLRVGELMHQGEAMPLVSAEQSLSEALVEISAKGLGMAVVGEPGAPPFSVFTDGDLRRTLTGPEINPGKVTLGELVRPGCQTLPASALAVDAAELMQDKRVLALVAVDDQGNAVGVITMHDLLQAGVV